jgi:hypothetical protein
VLVLDEGKPIFADGWQINVPIHKGEVNFAHLENQFGKVGDFLLDFDVHVNNRTLVLDLDKFGWGQPVVTWDLGTQAETSVATVLHRAKLKRLAKPNVVYQSAPGPSTTDIEVGDLDVFLSVTGDRAFTIVLPTGGRIGFNPRALEGLRIGVGLGIPRRRSGDLPVPATVEFGVDSLAVDYVRDLVLPFGLLDTNAIRVNGVRNGRLRIEREPLGKDQSDGLGKVNLTELSGTIEQIEVKKLVVKPPKAAP